MPWRDANTLDIFAPPSEPFGDNWVEQILGTVVGAIVKQYEDEIRWIWVTRYSNRYSENGLARGNPLPEAFRSDGRYRFIAFRASADKSSRDALHSRAIALAAESGCFTKTSGWDLYDVVEDLGSDRFIRPDASPEERSTRALLVLQFVDAYVRLMLDSLHEREPGVWEIEPNQLQDQNPYGSFFESVHHLFCNSTGVPLAVLLAQQNNQLLVRTAWMHPVGVRGLPQADSGWLPVRLRY